MDEVEARTQLPSRALPMKEYSRYYAWKNPGLVEAVYVTHDERFLKMVRQTCADPRYADVFPCGHHGKVLLVGRDERRWLNSTNDLPIMSGGGCALVTVTYNVRSKLKPQAECNGPF